MKLSQRFLVLAGVLSVSAFVCLPPSHGQSPQTSPRPTPASTPTPAPAFVLARAECKITRLGIGEKKDGVEAILASDLISAGISLVPKGTVVRTSAHTPADVLREDVATRWRVVPAPAKTAPTETRIVTGHGRATGKPSTPVVKVGRTFELTVDGIGTEPVSRSTAALSTEPRPGPTCFPTFTPPPGGTKPSRD